jgi:hypothetical protein
MAVVDRCAIAYIIYLVIAALYLAGFSLPHWQKIDATVFGVDANYGLWEFCLLGIVQDGT